MRKLSEREGAVLKAILECDPHGATGDDLVFRVRKLLGSIAQDDVTLAGVHKTAASLCRKNLAWRSPAGGKQSYRISQWGRDVIAGRESASPGRKWELR